jgi:Cytosine deaminase and related metal-dependent hydrolases
MHFPGSRLIIKNVHVIPLTTDTIWRNMDVVIENGKIQDIRPHSNRFLKDSFIDGHDKYLMPALIDCHVHYASHVELFKTYDSLYLRYGIAKVLALNGTPELLQHRANIQKGETSGPDIYCSGPRVNDPEMTVLQARELLKRTRAAGYDFVKIYSDLSKAGFNEISEKAYEYGLRIAGHIPQSVGTTGVLRSNQELVAHAEEFLYNPPVNYMMGEIARPEKPDPRFIPGLADSVSRYQKVVSPSLIAFKSILQSALNLESHVAKVPLASSHPIAVTWQWSKETSFIPKKFNNRLSVSRLQHAYDYQLKLVNAFNKAGVLILAGTDAPTIPGLMPGYSLHQELQLLCEAGLSNYEALRAATVNPARFLHVDSVFGTVELGKEASLVLLGGNPLEDVGRTMEVEGVIFKGKQLYRSGH